MSFVILVFIRVVEVSESVSFSNNINWNFPLSIRYSCLAILPCVLPFPFARPTASNNSLRLTQ